jgi:hypothetical protein
VAFWHEWNVFVWTVGIFLYLIWGINGQRCSVYAEWPSWAECELFGWTLSSLEGCGCTVLTRRPC